MITAKTSGVALCIECRHHKVVDVTVRSQDPFAQFQPHTKSAHARVAVCLRMMSVVSGEPYPVDCATMRSGMSDCGMSGKLFEVLPGVAILGRPMTTGDSKPGQARDASSPVPNLSAIEPGKTEPSDPPAFRIMLDGFALDFADSTSAKQSDAALQNAVHSRPNGRPHAVSEKKKKPPRGHRAPRRPKA